MAKRLMILFSVLFFASGALFGCTRKDGSEKLCEFLFSGGYEAEFDYSFSGASELSGSARVKKSDKVRIDFSSPDIFSSLSVESDEAGEPGVLIFNYYGMRAPLPEGALSKLSFLISFFSDEMPKGILSDSSKINDYIDENGEFPGDMPLKECSFCRADGTLVSVVFDASDGFPVRFSATSDTASTIITFTKLIPPDSTALGDKKE